ncbi:MAG: universal stress protein [Solirubrobacteraceae bacterium]
MFDNVIIGADDAEAGRDARALARALAAPHRQVTLAYVQVGAPPPDPDSAAMSLAADRQPVVEALRSLRDESHLDDAHVVVLETVSVAAGLHELASRHDADLLVIGAARGDLAERTLVRDDTHAVLKNPPCPVAVAPVGYGRRPQALGRIGAAYDGCPESERAVALARELAARHGGQASAFEAVREPLYVRDAWDPQPEIDERVAQARRRIATLGGIEASAASAVGDPVEALAHYAESVDLLVLGSHTYRPIDSPLAGSTAQRLADHAPCPLLVLARDRVTPAG